MDWNQNDKCHYADIGDVHFSIVDDKYSFVKKEYRLFLSSRIGDKEAAVMGDKTYGSLIEASEDASSMVLLLSASINEYNRLYDKTRVTDNVQT